MDLTFNGAIVHKANQVAKIVVGKQKDYGKDNILKSIVDPKIAIAVRLQDKLARLTNLAQNSSEPNNESLLDTAHDIVGYGLILAMVIEGTFELPLE